MGCKTRENAFVLPCANYATECILPCVLLLLCWRDRWNRFWRTRQTFRENNIPRRTPCRARWRRGRRRHDGIVGGGLDKHARADGRMRQRSVTTCRRSAGVLRTGRGEERTTRPPAAAVRDGIGERVRVRGWWRRGAKNDVVAAASQYRRRTRKGGRSGVNK